MNCDEIKLSLTSILDEVECRVVSASHTMVSSPFMNLDGDYPEVHIVSAPNGDLVLSDYGESLRSLANNNIDARESETRRQLFRRIDSLLGVPLTDSGRLQLQVHPDELGDGLLRMFQALAFVEDMVFTASPREEAEFKKKVADRLVAPGRRLEVDVPLTGRHSGRNWKADFYVHEVRSVYINAITAQSRGSFVAKLNHTYVMWDDQIPSLQRITLLDDTSEFLEESDILLLRHVSEVSLWSKSNEFESLVSTLASDPR